ncbi:hypothetical protein CXG81DRAFT_606, partial [Caulochytrium protostelioides]
GLYLHTVDRSRLDFDFRNQCSVCLREFNCYACLVCGQYFHGRGPTTHAALHALNEGHHVFIHTDTLEVYILPDNLRVVDRSLDDIRHVLKPQYTRADVAALHRPPPSEALRDGAAVAPWPRDLDGKPYLPGFMGITNSLTHAYATVVLLMLAHMPPLRDYLLLHDIDAQRATHRRIVAVLTAFTRRLWNARAFRAHVSVDYLLQLLEGRPAGGAGATASSSSAAAASSRPRHPIDALMSLIHMVNSGLTAARAPPVLARAITGQIRIESQSAAVAPATTATATATATATTTTTTLRPFVTLALDLPVPPVFQDDHDTQVVPQVELGALLAKYTQPSTWQVQRGAPVRYALVALPSYLILTYRRQPARAMAAHNPTIVHFDPERLTLAAADGPPATYRLIANVAHSLRGSLSESPYLAHLRSTTQGKWFVLEGMRVTPIAAEMIPLAECCVQIWER